MKEKYFTKNNIKKKSKILFDKLIEINYKSNIIFQQNKSALLILDMQDYFLNSKSHAFIPSAGIIINQIKKLINAFQANGLCIIATQHVNTVNNAKMMSKWWSDIITKENKYSIINPQLLSSNPIIIKKTQYDAFYNTNLDELLKEMRIKQLIVTGVMTHLCCETTIRSAFVRGFTSFFPIDATATYNYDYHQASFLNLSHGFAVPVLVDDILNQFK